MLKQGVRFLFVGAFNTAVIYATYCVLVFWWHPQLAWFTVFVLGLGLGFVLHTRIVFGAALAPRKAVAYLGVQLLLYALTSAVIHFSTVDFGFGPRVAAAIAIVINVPLSFVLSRLALSDRKPALPAPGASGFD